MSFTLKLHNAWKENNSLVCVGLDPDKAKIPTHLLSEKYPVFAFNKAIIDATADCVCAYKPQVAYYAGQDIENELKMTLDYIHENYPKIPVILDAKRGDIGSTATQYAKEAFVRYNADAVTLNPYMGTDTLKPFFEHTDRGSIILCRTSNSSGDELQNFRGTDGTPLYMHVATLARDTWNLNDNVLLVIGATYPDELAKIRVACPNMTFLVPGIGAQGGDVEKTIKAGKNENGTGLIINSSRGIIYAGKDENFAQAAREATLKLRDQINQFR